MPTMLLFKRTKRLPDGDDQPQSDAPAPSSDWVNPAGAVFLQSAATPCETNDAQRAPSARPDFSMPLRECAQSHCKRTRIPPSNSAKATV